LKILKNRDNSVFFKLFGVLLRQKEAAEIKNN